MRLRSPPQSANDQPPTAGFGHGQSQAFWPISVNCHISFKLMIIILSLLTLFCCCIKIFIFTCNFIILLGFYNTVKLFQTVLCF